MKQHGFVLISRKEIREISSEVFHYRHQATGARFVHVKNSDDNKVFSVGFRTPPSDHTGVAHIMEHSVLCGSEKFPVKDPFIELNKSSLKTFLNAMTYPDKTLYPVASRNRKDFFNLMDVYCDAVFHPLIYHNKNIFLQEGWHYEIEGKTAPLRCNGVVYNEMKGAFSSPDNLLFRKILGSLYPDTPYGFVSGGDPEYIPDLSYEEFLQFHRLYYHPSNSYLYLYGDIETEDVLEFLQHNYLKSYSSEECPSSIPLQKPFESLREIYFHYPVLKGDGTDGKTYLAYNVSAGDVLDPETVLGLDILKYILLDTPASPLRCALLEEKVGKSVWGNYLSGIRQPLMSFIVKGSEPEKKEEFLRVIREILRDCSEKGLDSELVEGAVNKKEFALREGDFQGLPRGLVYNIAAMKGWLYDREPSLHLAFEEPLQRIKRQMTHGYFEGLIKRFIAGNPHASLLVMTPHPNMVEDMDQKLAEDLQKKKESMGEGAIKSLMEEFTLLRRWQNTPDSPQEIVSLPKLELSDIEPEAERFPYEEYDVDGAELLLSRGETNGIVYDHIFYDL
ncbi:MAG TPA: insulinase family protein, partial [Firmicutes bacterium]|nr:insulinase family protein [Bacillota bacterium]